MWMMLQVIPILWRARRPSQVADMPAVVNTFWLRKGFEGLTFFGTILTPTQADADRFNSAGISADSGKSANSGKSVDSRKSADSASAAAPSAALHSPAAMKNHELIHLRQAQSCGDSWLRFYILYIWYWLKALIPCRKMPLRHAAYLLNPFEIEAYRHMADLDYLARCGDDGAGEWRRYARMPLADRLRLYRRP